MTDDDKQEAMGKTLIGNLPRDHFTRPKQHAPDTQTDDDRLVQVTQADREAAAACLTEANAMDSHGWVQAFARHYIEALKGNAPCPDCGDLPMLGAHTLDCPRQDALERVLSMASSQVDRNTFAERLAKEGLKIVKDDTS